MNHLIICAVSSRWLSNYRYSEIISVKNLRTFSSILFSTRISATATSATTTQHAWLDLQTRDISVYVLLDTQDNIAKTVRLRRDCAVIIMFTNACMHLYCSRFGLVSYASKRRLVTWESS